MSPVRVKLVDNFQSPFKDEKELQEQLKDFRASETEIKVRQRTQGRFQESIECIVDQGTRFQSDKKQLLNLNPDLVRLLVRKTQLEFKKLKVKKDAKILQAIDVEKGMRIRDRKTYKEFIKNPIQ
jgi:hypothetical protein